MPSHLSLFHPINHQHHLNLTLKMHPLINSVPSMAILLTALNFIPVVHAAALLPIRQSITPLTQSQIEVFLPYTYFASAGYCSPSYTLNWSCGSRESSIFNVTFIWLIRCAASCNANPAFEVVATGGDGSEVQYWFVGYDPPSGEVIVSHQGTNPEEM
jgi:hypothetical protein